MWDVKNCEEKQLHIPSLLLIQQIVEGWCLLQAAAFVLIVQDGCYGPC